MNVSVDSYTVQPSEWFTGTTACRVAQLTPSGTCVSHRYSFTRQTVHSRRHPSGVGRSFRGREKGESTGGGGRSRWRYSGREDLVVTMLELTVLEQRRARYWRGRDSERASHRHLLHESDELMFWLEECLVQGLRIVPGWLMPRLVWLLARADSELPRQIGGERRPAQLIEILYRAQERLMEQAVDSRKPARIIPLFRKRIKR